jgi:hypothetical protein
VWPGVRFNLWTFAHQRPKVGYRNEQLHIFGRCSAMAVGPKMAVSTRLLGQVVCILTGAGFRDPLFWTPENAAGFPTYHSEMPRVHCGEMKLIRD